MYLIENFHEDILYSDKYLNTFFIWPSKEFNFIISIVVINIIFSIFIIIIIIMTSQMSVVNGWNPSFITYFDATNKQSHILSLKVTPYKN